MPADLHFLIVAAEPERAARLRELRAPAFVIAGPGHPAAVALAAAVADPALTDDALAAVACMPALPKRRLLATFGALAFPAAEPRRKRYVER